MTNYADQNELIGIVAELRLEVRQRKEEDRMGDTPVDSGVFEKRTKKKKE